MNQADPYHIPHDRVVVTGGRFRDRSGSRRLPGGPGRVILLRRDVTDECDVTAAFDVTRGAEWRRASFNLLRRWAEPLLDGPQQGAAVMITSNSASRGTPGVARPLVRQDGRREDDRRRGLTDGDIEAGLNNTYA